MHLIDLASIDLNLLVVLDVLLEERHVTRAARRLHRTQSATSHALGRLREQLDDPILVRVGGGMQPTPRAERLGPEVRRLLRAIGRVLAQPDPWQPETSDRVFTLVGPDFVAAAFPSLLADMARRAPSVGVELVPPTPGLLSDVAAGRFDLAAAPAGLGRTDGVIETPVATLPWSVFARADHPAGATWGRDAWLAYPHIRVRTTGTEQEGPVDRVLAAAGLTRRRGPVLPHFMLAPSLLSQSDLLLTVPHGVLAGTAERFGLVAMPCPVPLPPIPLALYRPRPRQRDEASAWFAERVAAALTATFDAPQTTGPPPR